MDNKLTDHEHEVWLTTYSAVLAIAMQRPMSTSPIRRKGESDPNPMAEAAQKALEDYRAACAEPQQNSA